MRSLATLAAISLAAGGMLLPASPLPAEEVTKTLKAELSGADLSDFTVENLAGTMRIVPGAEGSVAVVATVHAETQALADGMRFERVPGEGGGAALRVRYPDGVRTIRYREPVDEDTVQISLGFLFFSANSYHYDGHTYRISTGHGKRIWADLEVQVPARLTNARFRNLAGLLEASDLEGSMRFNVASADLRLTNLNGNISLFGSSGDTHASQIRGSWKSEFSSGDCTIDHFEGDTFSFNASSGDLRARRVKARLVEVDTSSGDASILEADIEGFHGEASSGDLRLEVQGANLKDFSARTSSGDVALRLPREASFDATADQSSGDMEVRFQGGSETRRHEKLVAYRKGQGGPRIRVGTSSGNFEVTPH
jgi:hypothetical protein